MFHCANPSKTVGFGGASEERAAVSRQMGTQRPQQPGTHAAAAAEVGTPAAHHNATQGAPP